MPGLVLQAVERSETHGDDTVRVGFTASRRVGGAVARNRAKRRLRVAADTVLPSRAMAGRDYVLIARTETLNRRFDDLVRDLDRALKRLGCAHRTTIDAANDACEKGRP